MSNVVKDLVKEYELTSDAPSIYGGSTPTWEKYKGSSLPERIGSESEHPGEEPVQQEILDGRNVQASVENGFQQLIFERDDQSTLYDTLKSAADGNTHLWIRRTGFQAANAYGEIIGGEMGLTVSVGKRRPGSEGHRAFMAMFEAVAALTGKTIEPAQAGS